MVQAAARMIEKSPQQERIPHAREQMQAGSTAVVVKAEVPTPPALLTSAAPMAG